MKVIFLRHGEAESNVGDFINDNPARPVKLTPRGMAQAEAVAQALRDVPFSHAHASEFPRARQTARIALGDRALVLHLDARLNERKSGFDGLPTATFNDLVRADPVHIRPPAGESFLDQVERLRAYLGDLLRHAGPGAVCLAVSHENPILAATVVAGADPEQAARAHLPNCGQIILEHDGQAWHQLTPDVAP